MFFEGSSVPKTPSTHRAVVRLLSGVNSLVDLETTLLIEALPAHRAAVRFLPRMNALVFFEGTSFSETLPAL